MAREDAALAARLGPYQQIIAFRNVLIHGYDLIDVPQVWQVIGCDLPNLEQAAQSLIDELDR